MAEPHHPSDTTLVMTMVVRDEADILETNLRYHLAQGVDFIYALDHNSVDGTPDILRRFEQDGVLRMLREGGEVHDQSRRVTKLARMAYAELKPDWVINNDADEFWWPIAGNLKHILAAVPDCYGKLIIPRHDFLPRLGGDAPFSERMLWRGTTSPTPTGKLLGPKAVHRGDPEVVVAPGNHDATGPTLRPAPELPLIEVMHFPARTYEQFERKVRITGRGYELLEDRGAGIGEDQLKLLELLRAGELERYFQSWAVSDDELRRGTLEGRFVKDVRLRELLAKLPLPAEPRCDEQQAAMLAGGALGFAAELEAERAAHAETSAALAERTESLEALRSSRLLRATGPLRRGYHRLSK